MIKHTPPPNYAQIKKHFPANFEKGTVFTYYPDIYIKGHIDPHLLVHESTHLRQQEKLTPEIWWEKYFNDSRFRLAQEVEAYHNQYKHSPKLLNLLARDLSSPLYGMLCPFDIAVRLIKTNGQ